MIVAYGGMIVLLVLSLTLLFWGMPRRLSMKAVPRNEQTFVSFRHNEILEEEACGRLTAIESVQLRKDLNEEDKSHHAHNNRLFNQDVRFARWVMLGITVVVVLGSVSLYQRLGYAREVVFIQDLQSQQLTPEKVTQFLKYRSERYDRVDDWYYLATDYVRQENYQQAVFAFEKALMKLPTNDQNRANLLVEYAQALFYANRAITTQKMRDVVDSVLQAVPNHATALDLKGVAEFEQRNYLGAVLAWQEAVRNSRHSAERLALLSAIQKARALGQINNDQVAPVITDQVAVKIEWDKTHWPWQDDDILLVYAVVKGQKMPVAIQRVAPEELARPILLTNLDALMPTATLADVDRVDIVVKLASLHDKDLTKGRVIGEKKGIFTNRKEILSIKVAL